MAAIGGIGKGRFGAVAGVTALILLALLTLPFAGNAVWFGLDGLSGAPQIDSRFFDPSAPLSNLGIFLHMIAGAVITLLAPIQIIGALRRRWPGLHRTSGYVLAPAAIITAAGGLAYILTQGTIGGIEMSLAFALYGICTGVAAIQTVRYARKRDFTRHREWALRFFFLAIGSWLYRVQYGLWELATGGAGVGPAFDGPFDRVMNFAFFLPYLLLLEILFWRERRRRGAAGRPG